MTGQNTLALTNDQIPDKRSKAGESIGRIDVVFDDVKRKVIKAAKTPDSKNEKQGGL
jgi:hypothetical protein